MAGIQTDSHLVLLFYQVEDLTEFFEIPSHLRPFAGHRFKKHRCSLVFGQYLIQHFRDHADSCFCSLAHMASGVKIIIISRRPFHALQVICHRLSGKFPDIFLCRTCIQCIWCVCHDLPKFIFLRQFQKFTHILRIDLLRPSTSWISGKKCKRISPVRDHLACHPGIAFG